MASITQESAFLNMEESVAGVFGGVFVGATAFVLGGGFLESYWAGFEAASTPSSPPGFVFSIVWALIYISLAFVLTFWILCLRAGYFAAASTYVYAHYAFGLIAWVALIACLWSWYPLYAKTPWSSQSKWLLAGSIFVTHILWSLTINAPLEPLAVYLKGSDKAGNSEHLITSPALFRENPDASAKAFRTASCVLIALPLAWLLFAGLGLAFEEREDEDGD